MPPNNQYLIVSQSGRALASSAKRAGINTHVIDFFADEDTIKNTLSNHRMTSFSGSKNAKVLIGIVNEYVKKHPNLSLVIGSGFENNLDLLMQLEQRFSVIGNYSSTIGQLKEPNIFFKNLEKLKLPYPDYFTDEPDTLNRNFLLKKTGGSGGEHIKLYKKGMVFPPSCYLQEHLKGNHYSATFLANGESFHLLGFNKTWVRDDKSDFTFSGAISNTYLSDELRWQVTDAIRQLVSLFKIQGLCGLDFIVKETGQYSILEINPRPPATFELYDIDGNIGRGLFVQHLAAFNGEMKKPVTNRSMSRALGVLYAEEDIIMPSLGWPVWATDQSKQGEFIAKGKPVCAIHAGGCNIKDVKQQLMVRIAKQRKLLSCALDIV